MATETSNIDDILMGRSADSQPAAPDSTSDVDYELDEKEGESEPLASPGFENDYIDPEEDTESKAGAPSDDKEFDDYGNEKPKERMYTLAELNDAKNQAVRERLARMKATPAEAQQLQQQTQSFNADPNSSEPWQEQLESFVEQTFNKISERQVTRQQQEREEAAQEEFREKFTEGMGRFGDFREVVGSQPFDDTMTYALRGMKDPAAFAYAASKRHPDELKRISGLSDPYAKIVEMGKLEERMRKASPGTKAPRPVSRTPEDSTIKIQPKEKEASIESLIARSEAKKLAQLKQRRSR